MQETDNSIFNELCSKYKETKDISFLVQISDNIKSNKFSNIRLELDYDDLFVEYKPGTKLISTIAINSTSMDAEYLKTVCNDPNVIKRSIEENIKYVFEYVTEETYFSEYEDGKILIDYLIENDKLPSNAIVNFDSSKYIAKLIQKKPELLNRLYSGTLLKYKFRGELLLEYLIKENLIDIYCVANFYRQTIVYELLKKYDRKDMMPSLREDMLLEKIGDKTILEDMLDMGVKPKKPLNYMDSIEIIMARKRFDLLAGNTESDLLRKYNGKLIIDVILENNGEFSGIQLTRVEIIKPIIDHERYDLLAKNKLMLETLLKNADLNNTYLDKILDYASGDEDFRLSALSCVYTDVDSYARYLVAIAKHGLDWRMAKPDPEKLLKSFKGKRLIDSLLDLDKDLTMSKIISGKDLRNLDLAIYLKMKGIETDIKYDIVEADAVQKIYDKYNEKYKSVELTSEGEKLLSELKEVLLSDGNSEPEYIDDLILNYRYLIGTNNPYGISEARKIIELKQRIPEFSIKRASDNFGSNYDNSVTTVSLTDSGMATLNHEMGHALYDLVAGSNMPQEYVEFVNKFKNNPEILKKVQEYQARFDKIKADITKIVETEFMPKYDEMINNNKEAIIKSLNKLKETKMQSYLGKGYNAETLETVLDTTFSFDEFLERNRKIKKMEIVDAVIRCEFGSFISIADIIDAIFSGKYMSQKLVSQSGEKINGSYGHGFVYYSRGIELAFDETMANLSAIIKSPDANANIDYLKEILGEEFVNFITNYYNNNIAYSKKEIQRPIKEQGKAASL